MTRPTIRTGNSSPYQRTHRSKNAAKGALTEIGQALNDVRYGAISVEECKAEIFKQVGLARVHLDDVEKRAAELADEPDPDPAAAAARPWSRPAKRPDPDADPEPVTAAPKRAAS